MRTSVLKTITITAKHICKTFHFVFDNLLHMQHIIYVFKIQHIYNQILTLFNQGPL